jgi:hypothetical protein
MFTGSMTIGFAAGFIAGFNLRVAAFATFAFSLAVFFCLSLIVHGLPVVFVVSWTVALSMVLQIGYLAGVLAADTLHRYMTR